MNYCYLCFHPCHCHDRWQESFPNHCDGGVSEHKEYLKASLFDDPITKSKKYQVDFNDVVYQDDPVIEEIRETTYERRKVAKYRDIRENNTYVRTERDYFGIVQRYQFQEPGRMQREVYYKDEIVPLTTTHYREGTRTQRVKYVAAYARDNTCSCYGCMCKEPALEALNKYALELQRYHASKPEEKCVKCDHIHYRKWDTVSHNSLGKLTVFSNMFGNGHVNEAYCNCIQSTGYNKFKICKCSTEVTQDKVEKAVPDYSIGDKIQGFFLCRLPEMQEDLEKRRKAFVGIRAEDERKPLKSDILKTKSMTYHT